MQDAVRAGREAYDRMTDKKVIELAEAVAGNRERRMNVHSVAVIAPEPVKLELIKARLSGFGRMSHSRVHAAHSNAPIYRRAKRERRFLGAASPAGQWPLEPGLP